ncbi:hypothetical protein MUK42_14596 [Musa troglodytarum]|uniref:Uncharacterized protein n=1 Tax=Musa troglodytarum TaxID=320322 RepID=A0A9E7I9R7_9LILI|nr:hypothetical protein MUK42_14596 [Musa troglodytarum]
MSSPILNRYEPSDVLYIRAQLVTSAVLVNAGNSFISHPLIPSETKPRTTCNATIDVPGKLGVTRWERRSESPALLSAFQPSRRAGSWKLPLPRNTGILKCLDLPPYMLCGTSWPSCYEPIGDDVNSKLDKSIIYMPVMEVLRSRLRCPSWYNVDDDGPPLV